ncbi:MAG TPA: lytic transglycosylase domain-containing protein [Mesorhizobium sp.]|jgi:hypothetical protein|nr:lytic transglycosylase domain-containing protein [Mesorhizobium sp.]
MTMRFGFCLLPLLFAAACSTSNTAALAPDAAQTEDVAMLPEAAPLPASREGADAAEGAPLAEVGYAPGAAKPVEGGSPELNVLIARYAQHYDVPESLVRRVVKRESNFRPGARNGPYWGLMQILPATARGMGFEGPPSALLDAETNLKYAVKYLRGAYLVAGGDHDQSVRLYARGYYYDAKRKGLLEETGLRKPRKKPEAEMQAALASAPAARPVAAAPAAGDVATQWQAGVTAARPPASALSVEAESASQPGAAPAPTSAAPADAAETLAQAPTLAVSAATKGGRLKAAPQTWNR